MKSHATTIVKTFFTAFILLLSLHASAQLKISQVYGAGGNTGATYNRDFVEIFNPTSSSVTATSWSIQYASNTGISWQVQTFTATIPAGGYLLIGLGSGANGVALPTVDVSGSIAMAGGAGKVALVSSTTALSGSCPLASTVDFVGYGATANCFEGSGPTPAPSATLSVFRALNGCTDSNNNASDFSTATPAPRNSASPVNSCSTPPTVTTTAATNITTVTADLNGTVNANGASTTVTFNYGTTIAYGLNVAGTPSPVTGTSPTSVSAAVSGLSVNTLYNFRVSGVNAGGTSNGGNLTFYTLANVPSAPVVGNPGPTTLDVSIASGDGNPASTEYAIEEVNSGLYVQGSGSLGASAVWNTSTGWGTKTVNGLANLTTYSFRAKARNGALVETGFGGSNPGTTLSGAIPAITVVSSLSPFSTVVGTPSVSQSYTVSGSNLVDDISIAPSAGYEIRTGANPFSNSTVVLVQSGGTVATTTIDVRFNPATSGSTPGIIFHTSNTATTQQVSLSGTAIETEPTIASSISFGALTTSSIEVNTSGGNGTRRIVVARQGAAVSFAPVDGASVSGVNSDFSLASDQGSGNKIVYDGTGTNVTVSNLTSNTTYHFAVYEYNGTGIAANYQTTGFGTGSQATLVPEPTTAASLSFTRIKADTCGFSFTGGNGSGRIVIVSTSPVSFTPVDGTVYTGASNNFGTANDLGSGNKLVLDGASTSMILSGLSMATTYYVRVFEYNGTGVSINYNAATFGSGSFTTPSNISYSGGTYTQDFNSLPASGSSVSSSFWVPYYLTTPPVNSSGMTGWQYATITGSTLNNVFSVDTGNGTSGGTRSYGFSTSSTDRALGMLSSGSSTPVVGAVFENTSGSPLTSVTISFTGEQWRRTTATTPNFLTFGYQIGGVDITSGTFTAEPSLNFQNPVVGASDGPLDGNQTANRTAISYSFPLAGNWLPGQTLVLRWTDNNDSGNDHGLAIDDFSFSATGPVAPTAQDSTITFSNILTTSMDVSWLNGDGASRIVVINTSNSFTNPTDGTNYPANNVYAGSGDQVIYNGNGSTVNVSGLTAGTTYYFRVFAYNGSGASSKYITSTALDNPASQSTAAASAATQLAIISVNGGVDPLQNAAFSVVVQAQDGFGSPQNVGINTTVSLSVFSGFGSLSGTTSGVITAGTNTVTITGVVYNPDDFGIQLQADATAGETLTAGISNPFNVIGLATQLGFASVPASGIINTNLAAFSVQALNNSFSVDNTYTGNVTISKQSGPGNISGTLTQACTTGVATFSNIQFDQPGTYELLATASGLTSATSSTILITNVPTLTELVVPQYFAGKTASGTHSARTPFAVCVRFDNLVPNTAYDVRGGVALTTDTVTSFGAGNLWTGIAFNVSNLVNAFTTDGTGSSGPFWIYIQPTNNATRFGAGQVHNLRFALTQNGGIMPVAPSLIGTKTLTGLDVGLTAQTVTTADDGAFIKGSSVACISGKYVLLFSDSAGAGDPMFVYQARQAIPTNTNQSELPTFINEVYLQSVNSAIGDYVGVMPIGSVNPNGLRRIEVRNADNTLFNVAADGDGVWAGISNTTGLNRRDVAVLTETSAPLSTLSFTTSSTPESCTGANDGSATATIIYGVAPITYLWSTGATTATASGLAAGVYTVTVTDANSCSQTASVTVAPPAGASVTASGPLTFCSGGSVTLTAGAGDSYLWSTGETTQSIVVTTAGTYSVTVTIGTCVASSLPVNVSVLNFGFSGTIYSENMGTLGGSVNVNSYTGFQNTLPFAYTSTQTLVDVRTTTSSSGYSGASGSANLFFGTSGGNNKQVIISGINTLGYTSLTLSYGLLRTTVNHDMTVEVSSDGTNYTPLTVTQPPTASTWALITASGTIPSTENLRIRFTKNSTTSFRLDDVKLTGTTNTVFVGANGPLSVCSPGTVYLSSNIPSSNLWSPGGATTRAILVNTTGSYSVTATDLNGCSLTSPSVTFTSNPKPVATLTADSIACNGGTSNVVVTASGGTSPYTGVGTFSVNAGSYDYIVTDANGCADTVSVSITQPTALVASASVTSAVLCNGGLATVTVTASGGTSPYSGTGLFASVPAGTHDYIVTDALGCADTAQITVIEPALLIANASVTTPVPCYGGQGSVTVSATGGTALYTGTGVNVVSAGSYTYTVTDANGCSATTSITVTEPAQILVASFAPVSGPVSTVVTISGSGFTGATDVLLNGVSVGLANFTVDNDNQITMTVPAGATSGVIEVVNGPCSGLSAGSFTVTSATLTLNLNVFLEGYYLGTASMQPVLFNQGVSGATGLETDSIYIELRDSADATLTIDSDTSVLMTDGSATVQFSVATAGTSYWIVVKHRAAVQTWSAAQVLFTNVTSYDFTTASTQAYGSNMVEVEPGIWGAFIGDIDQDGYVTPFDFPLYELDNFNLVGPAYVNTDLDGDGYVTPFDFPVYELNNFNLVGVLNP